METSIKTIGTVDLSKGEREERPEKDGTVSPMGGELHARFLLTLWGGEVHPRWWGSPERLRTQGNTCLLASECHPGWGFKRGCEQLRKEERVSHGKDCGHDAG